MKSQISFEFLLTLGFIVAIIIPLLVLFYEYSNFSSDEIINSQTNLIAARIVDTAESVHSLGEPSQTNFRVTLSNKISGAVISNNEVLFNVSTNKGTAQIYKPSTVDIHGSLPASEGVYDVTVKAANGSVYVSYK